MKKYLIATGVGALMIAAPAAVSAASGLMDRITPVDRVAPADSAVAAKPAAGTPAPLVLTAARLEKGTVSLNDDRVEAPRGAPLAGEAAAAPAVIDRLGAASGSYNAALSAVSQTGTCYKSGGQMLAFIPKKDPGSLSSKCADESPTGQNPTTNWFLESTFVPILALTGVVYAISDANESD